MTASAPLPQAILVEHVDGGLPIIRSLARRGVRIAALAPIGEEWVARSRMAEGHVLGKLPAATEQWLSTLGRLAERGAGVLISGSDRATQFLVAERGRIPECLHSFESPRSAHLRLMDKASLYELAEGAGVRIPWSIRLSSHREVHGVAERANYPCLLKPALSHQWRRMFGERRVLTVARPEQLAPLAGPALDAGIEMLVTEHVPGPDTNIEGIVSIRREDGSYPLCYGRRKLRQYPPGFGAGSLFVSASMPQTAELADRLLSAASFVGVSVVEAKRHAVTGEMVLIEVNVRVPQSFAVGDASGTDASWRLYSTLAGLPLPEQPSQVEGVKVIVPSLEPRAAVAHLEEHRITLRELISSYRGVRSLSGHSVRDPLPVLSLAWGQLRMFVRFLARRLIRRRTAFRSAAEPD